MQSAFIPFTSTRDATPSQLNLMEFWCCLLFQSLPASEMEKYLPSPFSRYHMGLNVANPLWQGFNPVHKVELEPLDKRHTFAQLVSSKDNNLREYYLSLSRSFSALGSSPNSILRSYFKSLCLRRQLISAEARTSRTLKDIITGCNRPVVAYKGTCALVLIGNTKLRILKEFAKVEQNSIVHIQGFLSESPRDDFYASSARESDPANRLAIKLTYTTKNMIFSIFIRARGETTVKDMNTLVEQLDGVDGNEIARRSRRRIPLNAAAGRTKSKKYT